MPERPLGLEEEIRAVVEQGDFRDMRHLLDTSTVTRALIGVCYTEAFQEDQGDSGNVTSVPE